MGYLQGLVLSVPLLNYQLGVASICRVFMITVSSSRFRQGTDILSSNRGRSSIVIAAAVAGAAAGLSFNGLMLLYVSAVLSVLHSLITTRAAPNMLSLRNKALNKDEVKARFDRFKKWQDRRATLQLLTFLDILLAFAAFV